MLQTAHKRVQSQDYLSAHVYEYTIETTPEEAKHKQAQPHPCSLSSDPDVTGTFAI